MNDRRATSESELAEAARFQRDLYLYWREVERARGVALTGRGFVSRPGLRRMRARLAAADGLATGEGDAAEADDHRLLFIRRLLTRLGLLRVAEDRLVAGEPSEARAYFTHSLGARVRLCLRTWVAGGWWPDRLDTRGPLPALMSPAPPRIAVGRRRLLDALAEARDGVHPLPLPTGTGASASPGSSTSRGVSPARAASASISRPLRRARDVRRTSPPLAAVTDADTWRAALEGPLTWLGLVATTTEHGQAGSDSRGYHASPRAASLIADEVGKAAEPAGRVVLQPNFEVVAYSPLSAPMLATLDVCADEAAFGQVCRYRLTREAARRAGSIGWSADEVTRRLEALAGAALPGNVAVTLRDWERQVERLRLTPETVVLDVDDAAELDALLADPAAARWVQRRLTDTAALLEQGTASSVRAWLLRRGAFPALVPPPAEG
jgi:hypothetical protein